MRTEQTKLNKKLCESLKNEELANKAKTRFLAAASHDLRQPLNTMSIYLAALKMQSFDKKSKSILDNIVTSQNILSNQLDSLLDISKLDAGVVDMNFDDVRINELLQRLLTEYQVLSVKKGIQLGIDIEEDIFVYTDVLQIERVLRNLMSNAIKFTQEGSVTIRVRKSNDSICLLEIIDTGCGIENIQLDHIFQEFYQIGNEGRDRNLGLGLGLSIVKRLCDLLDIGIHIESKIAHGSTVRLQLYLGKENFENFIEHSSLADFNIYNNLTVLIVDDEESIRKAMKILLRQLKVFAITANDTEEAVLKTHERKPDIILVDYRLQNGDNGIRTINGIRDIYPNMPAIIITGDIEKKRLLEIIKANIPLLHKPYKLEHLTFLVEKCLKSPSIGHEN